MFDTKKSRDLSTDRVPLREFAADHGRSSRSPSPPGQDPPRPDTNYRIRPPGDDPVDATDSLLRPAGVFRFFFLQQSVDILHYSIILNHRNFRRKHRRGSKPSTQAFKRKGSESSKVCARYLFQGSYGVGFAGV